MVIAILGIVAGALSIALLQARATADVRAAEAHASNVYRVAFAHLSISNSGVVVTSDCREIYVAGQFTAYGSDGLASCEVFDAGDGTPRVEVVSRQGVVFTLP